MKREKAQGLALLIVVGVLARLRQSEQSFDDFEGSDHRKVLTSNEGFSQNPM